MLFYLLLLYNFYSVHFIYYFNFKKYLLSVKQKRCTEIISKMFFATQKLIGFLKKIDINEKINYINDQNISFIKRHLMFKKQIKLY